MAAGAMGVAEAVEAAADPVAAEQVVVGLAAVELAAAAAPAT
jgi:hypothetical protein